MIDGLKRGKWVSAALMRWIGRDPLDEHEKMRAAVEERGNQAVDEAVRAALEEVIKITQARADITQPPDDPTITKGPWPTYIKANAERRVCLSLVDKFRAILAGPPCAGCGTVRRERSACPSCAQVLCQRCAERPYEFCCDGEGNAAPIARVTWADDAVEATDA